MRNSFVFATKDIARHFCAASLPAGCALPDPHRRLSGIEAIMLDSARRYLPTKCPVRIVILA